MDDGAPQDCRATERIPAPAFEMVEVTSSGTQARADGNLGSVSRYDHEDSSFPTASTPGAVSSASEILAYTGDAEAVGLVNDDLHSGRDTLSAYSDISSCASSTFTDDHEYDDPGDEPPLFHMEHSGMPSAAHESSVLHSSAWSPPVFSRGSTAASSLDRLQLEQAHAIPTRVGDGNHTSNGKKRGRDGRTGDAQQRAYDGTARSRSKARAREVAAPTAGSQPSSIDTGWQWHDAATCPDFSSVDSMTYARSDSTLSHELAAALLKSHEHMLSGPRPPFLRGPMDQVKGTIFKEHYHRRSKGTDRYIFKGGANNSTYSAVLATTSSGKDVVVQRSYGSVFTTRLMPTTCAAMDERRGRASSTDSTNGNSEYGIGTKEQDEQALRVHQYCFQVDGKALWPRLYHIQPQDLARDDKQVTVKTGTDASAKSTAVETTSLRGPRGTNRGRGQNTGPSGIKMERKGNARGENWVKDEKAQHTQYTPQPKLFENAPADTVGLLHLTNTAEQSPWITFHHHASGMQMGAIKPSPDGRGVELKSRAGDFAEWHPRAPDQLPFEAGDLIALGPDGLTLDTQGAQQLGIISRQMVVAGSMPATEQEQALGDTVAYTGRVVLKLRGGCTAGDHLVPSGLQDGTAIAKSIRGNASVGKALVTIPLADDGSDSVRLVECVVLGPASTVNRDGRECWISCCTGWPWKSERRLEGSIICPRQLLFILCWLVAVLLVLGYAALLGHPSSVSNQQLCSVLEFPAHMKMSGQCDGSAGSRCVYQRCDEGFDMRRAHVPLVPLTVEASVPVSRECKPSGNYDGEAMTCVRRQCPAVIVNCSSSNGCCTGCEHGIQLAFSAKPTPIACQDPLCLDGPSEVVKEDCPRISHYGHLTRRCLPTGHWGPVEGNCTRKTCAPFTHHLDGYSMLRQIGASADAALSKAVVKFPEAHAGSGALTLSCPSPQYLGNLTMTCANGSTEWTGLQGSCVWQHCAAQPYTIALQKDDALHPKAVGEAATELPAAADNISAGSLFVLQLPNLTVGESVYISCCSSFTPGGGCAQPTDGIGEVYARCSWDGKYTVSGSCETPANIGISLSAAAIDADIGNGSTVNADKLGVSVAYKLLLEAVGPEVSQATAGEFTLPSVGFLGILHMRRGKTWRPVVVNSGHTTSTLNTHAKAAPTGSRAVALGNVACRQMGFGGATLVTDCRGLHLLHERTSSRIDSAKLQQVYQLVGCSKKNIDRETGSDGDSNKSKPPSQPWIAVQSFTDQSSEATLHGMWLPGPNHSFHGPPPWAVHNSWAESFCVGNEIPAAPVGVTASPCEITPDGFGGSSSVATRIGICARTAGAVAHCYRDQLSRYAHGVPKVSINFDLDQQLLLACTGNSSWGNDQQLKQSGENGRGTWLVGDGLPSSSMAHDDLAAPKIFANTLPHRIVHTPVGSERFSPNEKNITSTLWAELRAAAVRPAGHFDGAFARIDMALDETGPYSWSDKDTS